MKTVNFKKLFSLILSLVIVIGAVPFTALPASAAETEDGFVYKIVDGEVTITNYNGSATELVVPESFEGYPVRIIGKSAFAACHSIVSITLPEGLKTINMYGFKNCSKMVNITIPKSLEYIEENAFENCSLDIKVYFNGTEREWGNIQIHYSNTRFRNATRYYLGIDTDPVPYGLRYEIVSGEVVITDYLGSARELIIPETIDGYPVTKVGNGKDMGTAYLTRVNIPEGVKSIGAGAFYWSSVSTVIIPASVTSIGTGAFELCSPLTVYYSGTQEQWDSLISKYYAGPDDGLYEYTLYLVEPEHIPEGLEYLIHNGEVTITKYKGNATDLVIPDTIRRYPVTAIGDNAFNGCGKLKSITLPESVTSIGEYAFSNCTSLGRIVIPDGVTTVNRGSFYKCTSLAEVILPEGIENIGENAFWNCQSLKGIALPESITSIGKNAFENCTSLVSINIPEKVTDIGNYAFRWCESLVNLSIPDSVTFIGTEAFYKCQSLKSVNIPEGINSVSMGMFRYCSALESIEIPEGVTEIMNYAFQGCSSLGRITIPASVNSIGDRSFDYSGNFVLYVYYGSGKAEWESISIGFNNTAIDGAVIIFAKEDVPEGLVYEIIDGEVTITDYTGSAVELVIPDTIEGCPVMVIGDQAFYECTSLVSITFPDSVRIIGDSAFQNCTKLESITIPDSVTSIGEGAFYNCASFESITIPNSVVSIDEKAFCYCNNLTTITVATDNETYYSEGNCIIRADDKTLIQGCNNSIIPEGITGIGDSAFFCSAIVSITIPDSVTSIDDEAFAFCANLSDITIPDTVISIGVSTFMGCSSLKNINLPDSITSIGERAFNMNTSLESITIPNSLTSIGESVFESCPNLKTITIPDSITSIEDGAFSWCSSLSTIYYGGTEEEWNSISIDSNNECLTNAEIIFLGEPEAPAVPEGLVYEIIDGEVTITDYTGSAAELVIPDTIEGCPVTSIGYSAFYDCTSLANITLPETVIRIDNNAFANCTKLSAITIPDGVTYIAEGTFNTCDNLKRIILPGSVTNIGAYAFEWCYLDVVYFCGTEEQWKTVTVEDNNENLLNAEIVYFDNENPVKIGTLNNGLEYIIENGTVNITGYFGDSAVITIPNIIEGYSVTGVTDLAFSS